MKMTRTELVDRLRELGYEGPVSYAKDRLEEMLRQLESYEVKELEGSGPRYTEWQGIKTDDDVQLEGASEVDRWKFRFYFNDGKQEYVEIVGVSQSTGGKIRTVYPHKIRTALGLPVVERTQ